MSQTSTGVKAINILGELDRLKIAWSSIGGDEIRVACPAHEDTTPSASLNVKEHVFKCFVPSCGAMGDFVAFLAYFHQQPRSVILTDLQTRYPDIGGVAEIPSNTVEKFHAELRKAGPLLGELHKRGVTDDMMRRARLGFHDGRITIPVYDLQGRCRNIRRYLPGAPSAQKMRNTVGHGTPQLYRGDHIKSAKRVVICGGEMKALVLGETMVDAGINDIAAVCSTGGEGHWRDEWSSLMEGKDVYICLDIDDAGVAGSRRIAMAIYGKARSVSVVTLPLDKAKFPKGDINDWIGQCSATAADVMDLLDRSPAWIPPQRQLTARGEPRKISIDKAMSNTKVAEVVEVEAIVAAADQTPFLVPSELDVECTRDQPGCAVCPVKMVKVDQSGWSRVSLDPGSAAILGMLGTTDKEQRERTCEALGIPTCKVVRFHVRANHVAHDVRLSPPIDMSGGRVGDSWYPAVIVGPRSPDLNVPCRMVGAVYPHPKTQQAVALVTDVEELEDTLSTFSATPDQLAELRQFTPKRDADELRAKLHTIADDLSANVTWIYGRPQLHWVVDIVYHSVLLFNLYGRQINGWINALVIGDSAQGKSECATRLMQFYGLGDKVDCKNATVAGLLGGLEQLGNRWFIRWGAIPRRDRMAVILEELKGASTEVISRLTEMRSSGIAEIPKIERRRTMARTRILALSNARSPRPIASFHFGVEAIVELIGALEDVRRFDIALVLGRNEVTQEAITSASRRKVERVASQEAYRRLVLWAWTRSVDQVVFDEQGTKAVTDRAAALTDKYSEAIPLVDKGTMRQKLARVAVAIAARTFASPDGHRLYVQAHHVVVAAQIIDEIYSSKIMGYDDFSAAQQLMSSVQDPEVVTKAIKSTKHPADLASVLLRRDTISIDDVQSASTMDYDGARELLSLLVRKGALLRVTRSEYAKNPDFINILKQVRASAGSSNQHDVRGDEF